MKRLPAALLALLSLLLSYFALRLAWADYLFRTDRPGDLARAARIAPSNPDYQARLGNLRRAIELNPYFAAAWLDLATDAEGNGNFAEAERCLLEAARVDVTFAPRWALANFYFRRDRRGEFWKWLRLTAERSYGDRAGLFQLAWRTGTDGTEIEEKLTTGLADVLALYLEWLGKEKRIVEAAHAAVSLAKVGGRKDAARILEACHQMVEAERPDLAGPVWDALTAKGWVRGTALTDPDFGLINPNLEWKPTGKAFDWRLPWRAGVEHIWRVGQLTIRLDGREEEKTELLAQAVIVRPETEYEFQYRYQAEGLAKNSGIRWRAYFGSREVEVRGEALSSGDWRLESTAFRSPREAGMVRMVLVYERALGTIRPEGSIMFDGSFSLVRVVRR